jgi:hypothetical protein
VVRIGLPDLRCFHQSWANVVLFIRVIKKLSE